MSTKKSTPKPADKPVKNLNPEDATSANENQTTDTGAEASNNAPEGPVQNQKVPEAFLMTKAQLEEFVDCINSVVGNKYARQTIFNCLNGSVTPVAN